MKNISYKTHSALTLALCSLIAWPIAAQVQFVRRDIPAHHYTGGWEHYVGGGVAAFDCNNDYFPDLYVAGGESPAALLVNTTGKRKGTVRFIKKTPAGLNLSGVIGTYPLDIDSDGLQDLAVIRVGQNKLFKGQGNCQFSEFPAELGFRSGKRWTTAFSATWEGNNTLPTLAFGNYVDRSNPDGPFKACDKNYLYRPAGQAYHTPLTLAPGYCPLSMLFTDWGNNGQADLRISNDRHYYVQDGQEQMWKMQKIPRLYLPQDGWSKQQLWGMGIAARDITGDGIAEVFLTSMGDQHLQSITLSNQNSGKLSTDKPIYGDAPFTQGTTAHRPYTGGDGRPSTGWHVAFGDVQNDGHDDIFIAKGNVEQMPGSAIADPNNLLIQNKDGRFSEFGDVAGIASLGRSRGAALVDMNLDGALDLVVVNRRAPLELYQNTSPNTGHWLLLDIRQPNHNVKAVGARVTVQYDQGSQIREITIGGGHASGTASLHHFGLGAALEATITVRWPDGMIAHYGQQKTNRILQITRAGSIQMLEP